MLKNIAHPSPKVPFFFCNRSNKYYREWAKAFQMEDFQNVSRSRPTGYAQWDLEWDRSNIPNELQPFDISRLPTHLKSRLNPSKDFFIVANRCEATKDYRRRLFGEYGLASGVNVSSLFLNNDEIEAARERQAFREKSIREVTKSKQHEAEVELKKIEDLMEKLKENLLKMPEIIQKHYAYDGKQRSSSANVKQKNEVIMQEARDRYGFYLHPHDPKFKKLKEEFEEREKLERKQKKNKSTSAL